MQGKAFTEEEIKQAMLDTLVEVTAGDPDGELSEEVQVLAAAAAAMAVRQVAQRLDIDIKGDVCQALLSTLDD